MTAGIIWVVLTCVLSIIAFYFEALSVHMGNPNPTPIWTIVLGAAVVAFVLVLIGSGFVALFF